MINEFGGFNLKDEFAPVWQREPQRPASRSARLGRFWSSNRDSHAEARGAKRIARLSAVAVGPRQTQAGRRDRDACTAVADRFADRLAARPCRRDFRRHRRRAGDRGRARLPRPATPTCRSRATGTYLGHGLRAAIRDEHRARRHWRSIVVRCFRRATTPGSSGRWTARSRRSVVTGVGHWRGEGLALVEAARPEGEQHAVHP